MNVENKDFPIWLNELEHEDFEFMRQFILNSGSLKSMAKYYDVSYPTIRLRIDRLIQKVNSVKSEEDQYISLIKDLALEGDMSYETAKKLIASYKKQKEGKNL